MVFAWLTATYVSTRGSGGSAMFLLVQLLAQSSNLVPEFGDDVGVLRDVQSHVEHILTHLHPITRSIRNGNHRQQSLPKRATYNSTTTTITTVLRPTRLCPDYLGESAPER